MLSSLLGPHTHAMGCFQVLDAGCVCGRVNLSLTEVLNAKQHFYDISFTVLFRFKVKIHVGVLEHGLQPPGILLNSLTYDYVTQEWRCSLERQIACVGDLCCLNCAGSGLVFMGK